MLHTCQSQGTTILLLVFGHFYVYCMFMVWRYVGVGSPQLWFRIPHQKSIILTNMMRMNRDDYWRNTKLICNLCNPLDLVRFCTSTKSLAYQRRLMKELQEIVQNPHPDFKVFPTYERSVPLTTNWVVWGFILFLCHSVTIFGKC